MIAAFIGKQVSKQITYGKGGNGHGMDIKNMRRLTLDMEGCSKRTLQDNI